MVGAGHWGPKLIQGFADAPDWDLRWVCELSPDRLRRVLGRRSAVRSTSMLNDILSDPAVDAVAVATPASTHVEISKAVLESGRHVLVEKPLALSVEEACGLVELAEARGLTLMCNHTPCYTPAVHAMGKLIESGNLGDIHYVESVRVNLGRVQQDVDVAWDLAMHDMAILDVLLPKAQRPVAVSAFGADPVGVGMACIAHLTLSLPGGALAHIHVSWLAPVKMRRVTIGGSRRMAVWDDLAVQHELSVHDTGVDLLPPLLRDERTRDAFRYRQGGTVTPVLPGREALSGVTAEFAAAITQRRAPLTDGRSALRIMAILEAASHSMRLDGARQVLAPQY